MATNSSFYDVLGVPASATEHEIKAAYRKMARTCHPDVVAVAQRNNSAKEFMKIQAAYSTLSDPHKRATYDGDLFRQRGGYMSSVILSGGFDSSVPLRSRYSSHGARSWETDQCW